MNRAKWSIPVVIVAVVLGLGALATADTPKTVTGKASCGGCTGVVTGCCVLLTDKDGGRWVLRGDSESLKTAFKDRHTGKTMTATLAATAETKKGLDGKEYKEVKVSDVKVGS